MSEAGNIGEAPLERQLSVVNALGLHARAAAKIAELVGRYDCQISLVKDDCEAEADSVLSILGLDAPQGTKLVARCAGPQAGEALEALDGLFRDKFGEGK